MDVPGGVSGRKSTFHATNFTSVPAFPFLLPSSAEPRPLPLTVQCSGSSYHSGFIIAALNAPVTDSSLGPSHMNWEWIQLVVGPAWTMWSPKETSFLFSSGWLFLSPGGGCFLHYRKLKTWLMRRISKMFATPLYHKWLHLSLGMFFPLSFWSTITHFSKISNIHIVPL